MAPRPYVGIDGWPHGDRLDSWGRCSWAWVGLVVWDEQVVDHSRRGQRASVSVSGWLAADRLRRDESVDYSSVGRIRLAEDPGTWPAPRDRHHAHWPSDGLYLGLITSRTPLLPDHLEIVGEQPR
jgi:hypothetical protein